MEPRAADQDCPPLHSGDNDNDDDDDDDDVLLLSIQALLSAPNPDDPLANDVAELWKVRIPSF